MDSISKLKTVIKARGLFTNDQYSNPFGNPYLQVPPMPVPLPPTPATPSAPTTPPATSPVGFSVNPCEPNSSVLSCKLCKMSGFNASIGQITNSTVRSTLQRSINAISKLCDMLKGCSEDEDNNPAPYGAGTACVCQVLTSLITSFTGTFSAALLQDSNAGFNLKQINAMKAQLVAQERAARTGFDNCFKQHSPLAGDPSLRDKVIEIINSYAT
jgi:hypothetical protein